MNKTEKLYARRKAVVPNALGIFNPSSAKSAKGAIIIDADGRELIDFAGGIGVLNAGHCPEPVVKAIKKQAEKLIHTCFNVAIYEEYLNLAEKLAEILPHGEHTKVMLTNSGAESVENAIKIARQATGRSAVICFTNAFHGRSLMAMTLTSKVGYKLGCGPYAPEVYRLIYPYFSPTTRDHLSEENFVTYHLNELRNFFNAQVPANQVAAIIIELVQGEGGFATAPKGYIEGLRKICDEQGIILIFDEVQSGFGRTGKWAAYQHYGVIPDLSTWAKSMGSGMPIGAVIGKAKVMDNINPSTIGGTYLGNPVCAAASLATIKYMEEIDINAHGERVGRIVRARFEYFKQKFPTIIADVRGLGAMLAFELMQDSDIMKPNAALTKKIMNRCAEKGLLIISAGINGNCIRVLSPLIIDDELLNKGLDILEEAIEASIQILY